jgi:hypothetical protein
MITYASHWIVETIVFVVSYFAWRKYKTADFRQLCMLCVAGFLLGIWIYLVENVFHFPSEIGFINNVVSFALWTLMIGLVLKVTFFPSKQEPNKPVPGKEL